MIGHLQRRDLLMAIATFAIAIALSGAAVFSSTAPAWADELKQPAPQASSIAAENVEAHISPFAATPMTNALVADVYYDYSYAYSVLELINDIRAENGLSALTMDKDLLDAAMKRAVEASLTFNAGHLRPDGSECFTISNKMHRENIAYGQQNPQAVVSAWMDSPGHRANILSNDSLSIGIGCVTVGGFGPFWSQCFGPQAADSVSQPQNRSATERLSIPTSWLKNSNFLFEYSGYELDPNDTVQPRIAFRNQGTDGLFVILSPRTFTWASSNVAVASVNQDGLITGNAPGSASVTARIGSSVAISTTIEVDGETGTWKRSGNRWWFSFSNGSYARGWCQIDGTWYLFDNSGWMLTGWQKMGGKWYYFKNSGAMATGWQKVGGSWYYLKPSGAMATGWINDKGTWYHTSASGAMQTGWQKVGGSWYYLKSSGAMQTGWQKVGGSWYYLKASGAMATGWQKVGGSWYHLRSSGAMDASCWVSGKYYVNASGAMATNTWIGKYHVNANGVWDQTR
ncbi:CAP domain-containing protein [Adlercreutzia sp. R21]|uniref:CAP domain-containing protein n=1 Tax=Adlercreutzia wanghongyangiae TaxID=3111451 RepID=A0ABU6IH77_9ACTN|nr:CAP domain-containing protein [Adlercreutzia sp. R21]MEC4175708.1 CAP domain-containing protein [Adlercreutzia sp. R7]MEC4185360.1 CAP domain-containing protein [Adlercreutzia sp. R21]